MRSAPVFLALLIFGSGIVLSTWSCKHSPIVDLPDPTDTMPDTTIIEPPDTTDTITGVPCDPDVVYFDLQILPILKSNCAFSGCHDSASAEDGVILESYESVMATADVKPYRIDDSEIYEVLVDDDPDERMPPAPAAPLPPDQIQLIAKWILQGAPDLHCDPDAGGCDTTAVTFSATVKPVIDTHCKGCHSSSSPSGGIDLSTWAGVKAVAESGQLYGAIAWLNGYTPMPQGSDQLPDCTIMQIKAWIDAGAPDN